MALYNLQWSMCYKTKNVHPSALCQVWWPRETYSTESLLSACLDNDKRLQIPISDCSDASPEWHFTLIPPWCTIYIYIYIYIYIVRGRRERQTDENRNVISIFTILNSNFQSFSFIFSSAKTTSQNHWSTVGHNLTYFK